MIFWHVHVQGACECIQQLTFQVKLLVHFLFDTFVQRYTVVDKGTESLPDSPFAGESSSDQQH